MIELLVNNLIGLIILEVWILLMLFSRFLNIKYFVLNLERMGFFIMNFCKIYI